MRYDFLKKGVKISNSKIQKKNNIEFEIELKIKKVKKVKYFFYKSQFFNFFAIFLLLIFFLQKIIS
jgi:hypothetical protein